jgi:hypothetical protein
MFSNKLYSTIYDAHVLLHSESNRYWFGKSNNESIKKTIADAKALLEKAELLLKDQEQERR